MRVPAITALVVGLGAVVAPGAQADIPPLPGEQESVLLNVVETSGHLCVKVTSYKPATGADTETYGKAGLDPFTVECGNGKTYLVAIPRRGRPRFDPSGKPLPAPPPVVKEIEK
jgi:hypothetical protein